MNTWGTYRVQRKRFLCHVYKARATPCKVRDGQTRRQRDEQTGRSRPSASVHRKSAVSGMSLVWRLLPVICRLNERMLLTHSGAN